MVICMVHVSSVLYIVSALLILFGVSFKRGKHLYSFLVFLSFIYKTASQADAIVSKLQTTECEDEEQATVLIAADTVCSLWFSLLLDSDSIHYHQVSFLCFWGMHHLLGKTYSFIALLGQSPEVAI